MKRFLFDALISFVYWTGCLTPYMVWVVGVDSKQYLSWVVMQIIIVPPLGAIFAMLIRWLTKKLEK